ncbi:phosphatase PAP2 family protein [uncultured Sphingomonas sp.]|uniref:acid phosphatase n=1 Tax=uncultured Sphingomonas sp. TaxID=158754 RepID=UPI0025EBAFCA|nr:phosphatase PAP2 family protein [uncultured Sphingomonas sp.]
MKRALLALASVALLAADRAPEPYLDAQSVPDLMRVLPPPPRPGSPAAEEDRRTFLDTRKLSGTTRWALAQRDVTDDRFAVFACALNMRIDADSAPDLARVFQRMGDGGMVGRAKDGFAVKRPYLSQQGPICEPKTDHLARNGDYPSGHTANGWSTALILAELMPDRATEILRRGRQYGESRFICGSHSRSAVEAGYLSGAALVSALHASKAFRDDMEDAARELRKLRGRAPLPDSSRCGQERESSKG